MANPSIPVVAPGGPIPPPVLQLPWGKVGPNGDVSLTSSAYEFLQLLWSALQGGGGIIDLTTVSLAGSPGLVAAEIAAAIEQDGSAVSNAGPGGLALRVAALLDQQIPFANPATAAFLSAIRDELLPGPPPMGPRLEELPPTPPIPTFILDVSVSGVRINSAPVVLLKLPSGSTETSPGVINVQVSGGSGAGISQLTGDVTAGPGTGSQVATLATVNATVGTFGDATHSARVTVNAKGLVTSVTNVSISGGGGGGPGTSPAIRASNIQSSSAATYTVAWPTGTVLNDIVLIFYGGGFGVTTPPSGWIFLHNGVGSNYNGCVLAKQMTAGDITAGSVVVTPAGTFNSTLSAITINGATWGSLAAVSGVQNSSGTSTNSLTALGIFWPTTLALYWGASRGALNVTVVASGSAVQQALNATNSSGALYAGIPASALFGVAGTFNYSAVGNGFYDVIVTVTGV